MCGPSQCTEAIHLAPRKNNIPHDAYIHTQNTWQKLDEGFSQKNENRKIENDEKMSNGQGKRILPFLIFIS